MRSACIVMAFLSCGVASAADPRPSLVRVQVGPFSGSGTCVASDGTVSVIATTNHFDHPDYAPATVTTADGKLFGTILPGDATADVALVIVAGSIPAAELRAGVPKVDEAVWHAGHGSGGGTGKVVASTGGKSFMDFRTTCKSVSGDSGAGVFDAAGRFVAVHRGRYDPAGENLQCGGSVVAVWTLLEKTRGVTVNVVEQTERATDGTTVARRVARPAGVATVSPQPAAVVVPQMRHAPAPTVLFGGCANGRCFR